MSRAEGNLLAGHGTPMTTNLLVRPAAHRALLGG